ncbi:hypothetical protein ABK040_001622 [Willaertia magna]
MGAKQTKQKSVSTTSIHETAIEENNHKKDQQTVTTDNKRLLNEQQHVEEEIKKDDLPIIIEKEPLLATISLFNENLAKLMDNEYLDIWYIIVTFFEQKEQLNLRFVNKYFDEICFKNYFKSKTKFTFYGNILNNITEYFNCFISKINIKELTFYKCPDLTSEIIIQYVENSPNLEFFELYGFDKCDNSIIEALKKCGQLKEVNFKFCNEFLDNDNSLQNDYCKVCVKTLIKDTTTRFIEVCAICRNHISSYCIECDCDYDDTKGGKKGICPVDFRKCNHVYHKHCIGRWLKSRTVCPLCNTTWELKETIV